MKTPIVIATVAVLFLSLCPGPTYAQRGGAQAPAAPELLFTMTLTNETRLPLSQNTVTTPNVDLQLYGDGKNIINAVGNGPNLPRLFFGLCEKPCGFTLR